MRRATPRELAELLRDRRDLLETVNGKPAAFYEGQARRMENAFLRAIGEGGDIVPTDAARARVMSAMESIRRNGVKQMLTQAELDLLSVLEEALKTQSEYYRRMYGVGQLDRIPNRNIVRTFFAVDKKIKDKTILRTGVAKYERLWRADWNDHWTGVMQEVQSKLTRAQLTGQSVNSVARELTDELGSLNINGHIPPDKWARSFVRTNNQQFYSDLSVALGKEAGIEKFASVGVSDSRQSLECREAQQQPPMTMEDWGKWKASNGKGGRPGERHVMNCRCVPAPVPDALEDEWVEDVANVQHTHALFLAHAGRAESKR